MKTQHFIYKSDGLYYMQNVPEEPKYVINDGVHRPCVNYMFDLEYDTYSRALERAKSEAVKVESLDDREAIGYLILLKYNETKEGEIYTINMEEEIEVVDVPCGGEACPSRWGAECIHSKKVARIIPKKAEESEDEYRNLEIILENYRAFLRQDKDYDYPPDDLNSFIRAELENFEVKRKA